MSGKRRAPRPQPMPAEKVCVEVRVSLVDAVAYRRSGLLPQAASNALARALDRLDADDLEARFAAAHGVALRIAPEPTATLGGLFAAKEQAP